MKLFSPAGGSERTGGSSDGARMTQCSVLRDMQLCTTTDALDAISDDHTALQFQGLLVLENILGPSHPETTQQVCEAVSYSQHFQQQCFVCLYFFLSQSCFNFI